MLQSSTPPPLCPPPPTTHLHPQMKPFLLLFLSGTGSTWLTSLLTADPSPCSFGAEATQGAPPPISFLGFEPLCCVHAGAESAQNASASLSILRELVDMGDGSTEQVGTEAVRGLATRWHEEGGHAHLNVTAVAASSAVGLKLRGIPHHFSKEIWLQDAVSRWQAGHGVVLTMLRRSALRRAVSVVRRANGLGDHAHGSNTSRVGPLSLWQTVEAYHMTKELEANLLAQTALFSSFPTPTTLPASLVHHSHVMNLVTRAFKTSIGDSASFRAATHDSRITSLRRFASLRAAALSSSTDAVQEVHRVARRFAAARDSWPRYGAQVIEYEDVQTKPGETLRDTCSLLGGTATATAATPTSSVAKVTSNDLCDVVSNFDDLCSVFRALGDEQAYADLQSDRCFCE